MCVKANQMKKARTVINEITEPTNYTIVEVIRPIVKVVIVMSKNSIITSAMKPLLMLLLIPFGAAFRHHSQIGYTVIQWPKDHEILAIKALIA